MMRLYLVRHAQPIVAKGVCYGSADLPVDPEHQQQVQSSLLSALPARLPVFSSPLQRCQPLATGLAHALGSGVPIFDARLAEMDFGAWELRAWDAIPREEIDAWVACLSDYRPGGGESLLDVARRVRSFHRELRGKAAEAAVIVAHAGTIRMMLASVACDSLEEMVATAASSPNSIAYGGLTTIDC